jgi:hypothetical protein
VRRTDSPPKKYANNSYIAYAAYLFLYRVVLYPWLYPRFLSPLRNVPGPPLGNPLLGHYLTIVRSESCIPQREWVKAYGPVVRMMGILGKERLLFLSPEALQQIIVKDWLEYPRVRRLCRFILKNIIFNWL